MTRRIVNVLCDAVSFFVDFGRRKLFGSFFKPCAVLVRLFKRGGKLHVGFVEFKQEHHDDEVNDYCKQAEKHTRNNIYRVGVGVTDEATD